MIERDETFNVEDEVDHFKHVSAVRASKIANLKQQLKEANEVISNLIENNEYSANQWQQAWHPEGETKAQKSIRLAKEYKKKWSE